MKIARHWKEYQIIATGDGQKLERWGNVILLRPDPQVIWRAEIDMQNYPALTPYIRNNSGGGRWHVKKQFSDSWTIKYKDYVFLVKPTGFSTPGFFPRGCQLGHDGRAYKKTARRRAQNLIFRLYRRASVVCAASGAKVTQDAAKGMVERQTKRGIE